MSQNENLSEDRETYQPMPSVAEMFGEDLGPNPFEERHQDQTTAHPMGRAALNNRHQAGLEHQRRQLDRWVLEAQEDQALEKYTAQRGAGQEPDQRTTVLAARALERRGGSGLSSAEELASRYQDHGQQQATDDDKRRRQGRRPRG